MDADKFIDIAYKCGYSTKGNAKKYVKDNPKEDYDMDDLIVLHEGKMSRFSIDEIVEIDGWDAVNKRLLFSQVYEKEVE